MAGPWAGVLAGELWSILMDENKFWIGVWAVFGAVAIVLCLIGATYTYQQTAQFLNKGYCPSGNIWVKCAEAK